MNDKSEIKKTFLIIPKCDDLNRGDQALVVETMNVIKKAYKESDIYMMTNGKTEQCQRFGLNIFYDVLKHPSRFFKNEKNIKYNSILKLKWGIVAIFDFIYSQMLLNGFFRNILKCFMNKDTLKSIKLYENCDGCFVKGGGFIHDYTGGIVGIYTMYYQLYHIILAQKLNKNVYIMPNSFGPFKSEKTSKMVNKVLDKCKFVSARESISASSQTNGLKRNISLYPDLAFFLKAINSENIVEDISKFDINNKKEKYVAITVRPYRFYNTPNPNQQYIDYKKTFVDFIYFLINKGYTPLLVVHTLSENEHENDEKCINEIVNMLKKGTKYKVIKDNKLDCTELKSIYGLCEYVIGTRFHSVIFSIAQKIPAIAITYGGNKGNGIMKDLGLSEYAIEIDKLEINNLKEKFELLEKNKKTVIEKIDIYLKNAQKKHIELIDMIKEV